MNDLTIKERILKTLLESPKTTGKIAIELGYIDDKKHGRYNIIKPDLNTLEQYGFIHRIEKKEKRPGAPATTYDIVYEISVLRDVLEKYPSLIPDLQKNGRFLILLRREFPFFKEVGANYGDPNDWGGMLYTESVNDLRSYVMWMAEHSQTFLKNCLSHEFYFKDFFEIWKGINSDLDEFKSVTYDSPNTKVLEDVLHNIFLHAVITDKLNGVLDSEALGFIRQNPMPLRWERLLSYTMPPQRIKKHSTL